MMTRPQPDVVQSTYDSQPTLHHDANHSFGGYLRFLRRRARLTQTELSIAVGYSPGQISMLENGQRAPDISAVAALFVSALRLEKDRPATTQLLALAQTASQEHKTARSTSASPPTYENTPSVSGDLVITQQVIRLRQELGILEDIPPLPSYFVARPTQRQHLHQWLTRDRRAAICGLAGMGKSTLAAALAHDHSQHSPVFWLTFSPGLNQNTDALLHQLALFVIASTANSETIAPLIRRLANPEATGSLQHLLYAIAAGLSELTTPLLVFDDAHSLGDSGEILPLIQRLAGLAPNCQILFATRAVISFADTPHLMLSGLGEAEAATLVRQLAPALPDKQSPNSVRQDLDVLLHKTAGNPMLLRLAVSQAEIKPNNLDSALDASITNYLVSTVLDHLPRSARLLASLLATWRGSADITDPQLAELLSEEVSDYSHSTATSTLQRSGLIDHLTHATPHPLLREPLLVALNADPAQHQLIQRLAAQWAAQIGDRVEAAYHYCCAGDLVSACDLLADQGQVLAHAGKAAVALAIVDEVLRLASLASSRNNRTLTNNTRSQLLILRGDLLVNTLRATEGRANYQQALALTNERIARAQLAERLAHSLFQCGQSQDAHDLCEEMFGQLSWDLSAEAVRLRMQLRATQVKALIALARFDEANAHCQQALTAAKMLRFVTPSVAERIRASANGALGYIARLQTQNEEARQFLLRSIQYAHNANLQDAQADSLTYLSAVLRDLGDFAAAEEAGQRGLALAQAIGNDYLASNLLHYMALNDYYANDLARSLQRSQQATALKQQMGDGEGLVGCWLVQMLVRCAQGELAQAQSLARLALNESQLYENGWLRGLALYGAGVTATFVGDLDGAERLISEAIATKGFAIDRMSSLGARLFLAMVYVARGEMVEARRLLDQERPERINIDMELLRGLVYGMWELGQGDAVAVQRTSQCLAERARATGYHIYAVEAERLGRLVGQVLVLGDLPRGVCCL